jgi:hypothetical protein
MRDARASILLRGIAVIRYLILSMTELFATHLVNEDAQLTGRYGMKAIGYIRVRPSKNS